MRGGYDIVAAVTRTLAIRLQDAVGASGGELARTLVTARRPAAMEPGAGPTINVFLFSAVPNAFLRNLHEPWRVGGEQVAQPATALDLYYLLSFTGAEEIERLEAQRLLGIAVNALMVDPTIVPGDLYPALADDPSGAATVVELTPHALSTEELSRLWTMFPGVPYQLSVCYRASAAVIVAEVPVVARSPVRAVAANAAPSTGVR